MLRWLVAFAVGAIVGAAIVVGSGVAMMSKLMDFASEANPELYEDVTASDGVVYALYFDVSIEPDVDVSSRWLVYELTSRAEVESRAAEIRTGTGALLTTFEARGDHSDEAYVWIASDRFVVVTRAGLHHSIYDRKCRKLLVHETDPYEVAGLEGGVLDERRLVQYTEWKLARLHEPIKKLLAAPPEGCDPR